MVFLINGVISLLIIKFIVINVQIDKVDKHCDKTFTIKSIPCPTILNDIFFSEISVCKKNKQLDVCTSFHTMPIQMCNKHTWWKEVGPCMSYLDLVGSIHAWLILFKSFIPWVIWVWEINVVVFTMLTFTIPIGWYNLACCYIMLCFLILLKLFFSLKFFVFFSTSWITHCLEF
jgi:hypothetical protein